MRSLRTRPNPLAPYTRDHGAVVVLSALVLALLADGVVVFDTGVH